MRKQLIVPLLSASLLLAGCSQNKVSPKEYSAFCATTTS